MTPFLLRRAARIMSQGGVIAYPTEAVFGLGCDPLNGDAVKRLLAIKRRPAAKGLILIAADFDQVRPFVATLPAEKLEPILAGWPGPHTWVMPAAAGLPAWINGGRETVAVRVTAHPLASALCETFGGAIISTSANQAGRPPARSGLQARLRCPGVDIVCNGTTGGLDKPTTIRDAVSGNILR